MRKKENGWMFIRVVFGWMYQIHPGWISRSDMTQCLLGWMKQKSSTNLFRCLEYFTNISYIWYIKNDRTTPSNTNSFRFLKYAQNILAICGTTPLCSCLFFYDTSTDTIESRVCLRLNQVNNDDGYFPIITWRATVDHGFLTSSGTY
jgi:hypothetical protein